MYINHFVNTIWNSSPILLDSILYYTILHYLWGARVDHIRRDYDDSKRLQGEEGGAREGFNLRSRTTD